MSPSWDGLIMIYDDLFDGKSRTFLWIERDLETFSWGVAGFSCLPFSLHSKKIRSHILQAALLRISRQRNSMRFSRCARGITTKVSMASLVLMKSSLSGMPTCLGHLWFTSHVHHLEEVWETSSCKKKNLLRSYKVKNKSWFLFLRKLYLK